MADIPFVDAGAETADAVRNRVRKALSWLPDPKHCDHCGAACEQTRAYDSQEAAFHPNGEAPAWECRECEAIYRRDDDNPLTADMWDR